MWCLETIIRLNEEAQAKWLRDQLTKPTREPVEQKTSETRLKVKVG